MEEDEDILGSLIPVFEEVLNDKEILKLAESLKKKKLIADDVDVKKGKDKSRRIKIIFKSIKAISKRGWDSLLANHLDMALGKEDLSIITEESFAKNENVLWILHNWYELMDEEMLIKEAAALLTKIKLPKEKWLVVFADLVAAGDENDVNKAIAMIKEKLSSTSEQSSVAESENLSKSSTEINLGPCGAEIQSQFLPLLPLFKDCLNDEQVGVLINGLKKKKHISDGQKKKVKDGKGKIATNVKLDKILDFLKKNAKASWKEDMLEIMSGFTHPATKLVMISRKWLLVLSKDQSGFNWLVTNWDMLKTSADTVTSISKDLLMYTVVKKGNEPWLLDLVCVCSTSLDAKVNKFISKLQEIFMGDNKDDEESTSSHQSDQDTFAPPVQQIQNPPLSTNLPPEAASFLTTPQTKPENATKRPTKPFIEMLEHPISSSTPQKPSETSSPVSGSGDESEENQLSKQEANIGEGANFNLIIKPFNQDDVDHIKIDEAPNAREMVPAPVQKPALDIEQKIMPLVPLLNEFVSLKTAKQITSDMKMCGLISDDCFSLVQLSEDQTAVWKTLTSALTPQSRQSWETQILESLMKHAGKKITQIVKEFFESVHKEVDWKWLIYTWTFLCENEDTVVAEICNIFPPLKQIFDSMSYDESLLEIILICQKSPESKVKRLTNTLKEAKKKQKSKMDFSKFSFMSLADMDDDDDDDDDDDEQHGNENNDIHPESFDLGSQSSHTEVSSPDLVTTPETKPEYSKAIEEKLTALVPVLSDHLTKQQALQITQYLHVHLVKGINKVVEDLAEPGQILGVLFESMKIGASATWKKDFCNAFYTHGDKNLSFLVQKYLEDNTKPWSWFVKNWEYVVRNAEVVLTQSCKIIPNIKELIQSSSCKTNVLFLTLSCANSDQTAVEFLIKQLKILKENPEKAKQLTKAPGSATKEVRATSSKPPPLTPKPQRASLKSHLPGSDDGLYPLLPILQNCLEVEHLKAIARNLNKEELLSAGHVQQAQSESTQNKILLLIFQALHQQPIGKWFKLFGEQITQYDPHLGHIFDKFMSAPTENMEWRWLVKHWHHLLVSEAIVMSHASDLCKRSEGDTYKQFLLKLLTSTSRGKNVGQLVSTIKAQQAQSKSTEKNAINYVQTNTSHLPAKVVEERHQGTEKKASNEHCDIADEIQFMLFPMIPLLEDCLKSVQVTRFCKMLTNLNHIPEGMRPTNGEIRGLLECFRDNAKVSWKEDFLRSLEQIHESVGKVAQVYLFNNPKNTEWRWLIENWKIFSHKKKCAESVAAKHSQLITTGKPWLLMFTVSALPLSNHEMKQVIFDLRNNTLWNQVDSIDEEPFENLLEDEFYLTKETFTDAGVGNAIKDEKPNETEPEPFAPPATSMQLDQQVLQDRKTAELLQESFRDASMSGWSYDHYSQRRPLAKGRFLVEFQAIVTQNLAPGDMLCVYILHHNLYHGMNYDSRRNLYQFYIETSAYNLTYKYLVLQNGKNHHWEVFPTFFQSYGDIQNRSRYFDPGLTNTGLVITLDVVHLQSETKSVYEEIYEKTFVQFLPPFSMTKVAELESSKIPFYAMVKIVQSWIMTRSDGVGIKSTFLTNMKIKTKDESISKYLEVQCELVHQSKNGVSALRRVLSGLAYFVALAKCNIPLSKHFGRVICQCLSLHDLDEEQQNVVVVEVAKFNDYVSRYTRSSNTKAMVNKIVHGCLDQPECLLVLPLLQLLDNNDNTMSKPNLPHHVRWDDLIKKFRDKSFQLRLLEMGAQVLNLFKPFPWLREVYQDVLDLQTTSQLLNMDDRAYQQLFDLDGVLKKLLFFWSELGRRTKDLTEKMLNSYCTFIYRGLEDFATEIKTDTQRIGVFHEHCRKLSIHVKNILERIRRGSDSLCYYPGCFIKTLTVVSSVVETIQAALLIKENDQLRAVATNLQNEHLLRTIKSLFISAIYKDLDQHEVELWNYLTKFNWSGKFQEIWKTSCLDNIMTVLPSKFNNDPERMIKFYADNFDGLNANEIVTNCFTDIVTKLAEEKLKDSHFMGQYATKPKILQMCTKLVYKKWMNVKEMYPTASNYEVVSRFLIQWPSAVNFIKILGTKKVKLNDKIEIILSEINDAVSDWIVGLRSGNISLSVLRKIGQNKRLFAEVSELPKVQGVSVDAGSLTSENFLKVVDYREKQLQDFYETRLATQTFIKTCEAIFKDILNVDATSIKDRIEAEHEDNQLSDLVVCHGFSGQVPEYVTNSSNAFLGISEMENSELKLIYRSQVFGSLHVQQLMKATAENVSAEYGKTSVTLHYILQNIWIPVKCSALDLAESFDKGAISLGEVKKMLPRDKSPQDISKTAENQLKCMYKLHDLQSDHVGNTRLTNFDTCLSRINLFCKLRSIQKTVNAINSLRNTLQLRGKFDFLDKFVGLENSDKLMLSAMTNDVVKTSGIFENINTTKLDVLDNFMKHANLLTWLMENMKNIGEVKVMSDLAMISAGESPMEVDRVSCFLSAVMGFAPLIFDLPKTAGMEQFMNACIEVWDNVERDPSLEKKWKDTALHLEWLKATKDFHGSVENSSLTRAQQINEHGVYAIGEVKHVMPNIDDCMRIKLLKSELENLKDDVVMSLKELRDLQSRLMLIAGEAEKGKEDVIRFIDVLSHVENLTKTYVKLKSSGCMLFSNWSAKIRCNDRRGGVTVSVHFDEASAITSSGNVMEELQRLTTVLNTAYNEWIKYLNEKREKYYHLNHYSIHQITYLCKNLAKANQTEDCPDQVKCLLSSVFQGVSFEIIVDLLDEATRITDNKESINFDEDQDEAVESLINRKKKVVRKLVQGDLNLSENVAKAAVQEVKNLDLDECYLWALENEFDEEKVLSLAQDFDKEMGFSSDGKAIGVVKDVINNRMNLGLSQIIEMIQQNIEDRADGNIGTVVNTVCERYFSRTAVTSLSDCVSLEHLGTFLEMLNKANKKENIIKRKWPHGFAMGKPNLVVCNANVMWRNVLSIYMESNKQPLPSASEVLVCSETTTNEDVELLLRRAIGKPPDEGILIYCIACADQLNFGVAKHAEGVYHQLVQATDKNFEFRLIILTSSQQHYITSCFDEHQVLAPFIRREEHIKAYLKQQLHINQGVKDSAAVADKDRSCVRLVVSSAAGMGKSLFVSRCRQTVQHTFDGKVFWHNTILRFLDKAVNINDVVNTFYDREDVENTEPHFVHIDATPCIIVLGSVQNSQGVVWKRQKNHFYAIEYTEPEIQGIPAYFNILDLLPKVECVSPKSVLQALRENKQDDDKIMMDMEMLSNEVYQRPYQYLLIYSEGADLDQFTYVTPKLNPLECLQSLLEFCSIREPSWAELYHFASFLNVQLVDAEKSIFCNIALFEDVGFESGLSGFKKFVVKFMIRMSQDFATPSLEDISDATREGGGLFELHQLRRRWETALHPYLFFNDDQSTMSFVHFNITRNGDLCHPVTNETIEAGIMNQLLFHGLRTQGVKLQQNFDMLSRHLKLVTLCGVFGVKPVFDPDPTYELTTDNVLKMLAIHMRFRCDIPVVIMGETGCGKTRMVEFMSKLKAGQENTRKADKDKIKNMVVIKVHGGITVPIIQDKVREAVHLANQNCNRGKFETLLFLDEANTTEAIYAIKEVVCDRTVHGKPFHDSGLKIVAACNPYRKHSDDAIRAMEKSGLGFNVKSNDVLDKFAGIPMRHLVYRVTPLPPSMKPLVWDFGQLNNDTEEIYIKQMVLKVEKDVAEMPNVPRLPREIIPIMTTIMAASQKYMRERRDVCSFVSLRDVERTIKSFKWFYEKLGLLNPMIEKEKAKNPKAKRNIAYAIRALIQAVGMCYHATLYDRKGYRELVAQHISSFAEINEADIEHEIVACQSVFLGAIDLEQDIARNEALRENVFMIIVCAEMRIPLFLVGKPGSSKSLAKTIVTDAMQGRNSKSKLFQQLKQIHVLSFQCSAVSDAVGIETMFNQCTQLQKKQDLKQFVAVVVLDEIGLAEDSPKMPLKVLHPLLEVGSTKHTGFDVPEHNKVGFVGISNWALDPAKMNRGIFVTRGEPTKKDLQRTAEAIFESDEIKFQRNSAIVQAVTDAYVEVCANQEREFFGLRDYYALLKMIFYLVSNEEEQVSRVDMSVAVLRNFSGQSGEVFETFVKHLTKSWGQFTRPHISVVSLVRQNLKSEHESRFLLLLTKQYAAVNLLGKVLAENAEFQVIFGSSFPRDHDYTEVCRNINRIKVCMESGTTVVLLNLRDLYESLYDALNQHYVTFADQRYVDLGLGGHRVKCRIAPNFRLIVIEEREVVYDEFPIPLINRLEKHIFDMNSVLENETKDEVSKLNEWVNRFSTVMGQQQQNFRPTDAFVGFQDDTSASAILSVQNSNGDMFKQAKKILLQTATLDSVVRLNRSELRSEVPKLQKIYKIQQFHDSLVDTLAKTAMENGNTVTLLEITSFSLCLNEQDRVKLEKELDLPKNRIKLVTLQQLQTMEEYNVTLNEFIRFSTDEKQSDDSKPWFLLIQCPKAQQFTNLIACAKYCAMNKAKELKHNELRSPIIITFIFTLERSLIQTSKSFTTFHSNDCSSIYIDEIRPKKQHLDPICRIWDMPVSQILKESLPGLEKQKNGIFPVDIRYLLQDCIPDAVAKVNNTEKDTTRNQVRIVTNLCFDWKYSKNFSEALMNHVIHVMKDHEQVVPDSWIVQEACSQTALQEGGSFRNTLWLRLKQLVGLVVAKVISIADTDRNLDLIRSDNDNLVNLWFEYFQSRQLCSIKWNDVAYGAVFTVISKKGFDCQFPFSRLIINEMSKHWSMAAQLKTENYLEAFTKKVASSSLSGLLEKALGGKEEILWKSFTNDLLHIMYKPFSDDGMNEIKVITEAVLAMFKSRRKRKQEVYLNPLLEIFMIFMEMQPKLECLGEIIAAHPKVLESSGDWLKTQESNDKFTMHVSAFESVLLHLDNEASDIGQLDNCQKWKKLVRDMKRVAEYIIEEKDGSEETIKSWRQIMFVELFLHQLVPRASKNEDEYLKTISPLARRLWVGARKVKDFSDAQFLTIVTKTLQGCTKTVQLKVMCNWHDTRCKACRSDRMTNPIHLSCGHYVCQNCVTVEEDSASCPICRKTIPDATNLQPLTFTKDQKKEFEHFKTATTSLFLEYLSTFCFPTAQEATKNEKLEPPEEKILLALEALVICDGRTHRISPHLESFDANPTARSYILQLLLRCDKVMVQDQLNKHFETVNEVVEDRSLLVDIYIQAVQDNLLSRSLAQDDHAVINTQFAENLLDNVTWELKNKKDFNQIDHFDFCSEMIFVSRTVADCIHSLQSDEVQNVNYKTFLAKVCDECKGGKFLAMQNFLIKTMCRRFGMDAFNILLENPVYKKCLVPPDLLPTKNKAKDNPYLHADSLALTGQVYIQTKDILLNITHSRDLTATFQQIVHQIQQSQDSIFQILLALSVWAANSNVSVDLRREVFGTLTQKLHTHLTGRGDVPYFKDISNGVFEAFKLKSLSKLSHHKITELIVFSGLVYTSSDNGLLKVFKVMVSRPATVSTSFLPTMPQSNYFDVKDVMGQERSHHTTPKLYMCPNNHPYYIGECTNPVQAGQCPECGKKIGGQTYGLLHEGNTVGDLTEESQAGYLLKPAEKRSEPIPERTLTKMSVCATRACVHLALLHGSRNGNDVQKVLKLKNPKDVCPFLMNQLVKDLRQLAHCTGKSFDDAILLLQHIFQNMRIYNEQGGGRELKIDRMTARKQWEEAFQREFLSLVFRDTDIIINTAQQAVIDAAKQMQNPLQRMIHEHTMDMTLPEGPINWTCPQLWKYRTHITVQHLRLKLEAVDGKAEGAVLKLILNTEHLSEIKHLATIFNVQSAFIARYRQRVDIADTDENTIREFLDDGHQHMKEEIFKYIKVWNTVRGNLAAFDKYNTLRKHLEEKMTMDSPISMCLPSDRGRGCCALVLAEYLIEKQNEVLAKCRETMIEKTQFRQIDVSGVAPNNLICISENHDLLPLILANAQYEATTAEGGAKHNIVYNLDLLERKVTEQFILRRCFIKKETLPRMTYLQDVGLGKICIAMQTKFEQVPLPQKICQAVDTSAYNARTADICEAVRTITLIIQFLAKIGGELEQSICDYAERDLLLTNDETAMIPRSAKICHCLALFERFSWHRTLRAIENGQNPFELVSTETGEKMDGVLTQQLNDMLKQFNIERLQNELNALMMVGPELQSDWGLGEILQVYIDGKSENPDSTWCEKIPENICIKHTQHVFALSVKHSVKA